MQFDWTVSIGNILTMLSFVVVSIIFLIGLKYEVKYFRKEFDSFCIFINRRMYRMENRMDRYFHPNYGNGNNGDDNNGEENSEQYLTNDLLRRGKHGRKYHG